MAAFFVNMAWLEYQQIAVILPFVCIGAVLGGLLDVVSGLIWLGRVHKWRLADMLFGPLAGLITFCGALIWLDGQLHPLLFLGLTVGWVLEHSLIGKRLNVFLRRAGLCTKRTLISLLRTMKLPEKVCIDDEAMSNFEKNS